MTYSIVAPHPDDELIGCWSLLRSKEVRNVFFLYDLTNERIKEAKTSAEVFGFVPHFGATLLNKQTIKDTVLVLPSSKDSHPEHKAANAKYRSLVQDRLFYSVDLHLTPKKKLLEDKLNIIRQNN